MSDMKCPFCKEELNQDNPQSIECRNDDCKKSYFMYGSKELWQELIRTRKALEIAVDALDRMAVNDSIYDIIARNAMKRITAILENQNGNC